ncbi:MAG: hypothetical protein KDA46_14955 [Parvularculaceae bacterium]|nr:hypothetical protein [Parvularculaceae bacterium]
MTEATIHSFALSAPFDAFDASARQYALAATPEELNTIAERLGVIAATKAEGEMKLWREGDRVELRGAVTAHLMRQCVVTLEPMEEIVTDAFAIRFEPAQDGDFDDEMRDEDDEDLLIEPMEGESLSLGEVLIQQIAVAMSAHPRSTDADALLAEFGRDEAASPFAALKAIAGGKDD